MPDLPKKLQQRLSLRKEANTFRKLSFSQDLVDFSSNDYLGFAKNGDIFKAASHLLSERNCTVNGATGSRLLSGNHELYQDLEKTLAKFHQVEEALVFNSGYDANIGFFSSVPQRNDVVFYDEFIHASIRDGIKMGHAKSYKFKHNDLDDLKCKCQAERHRNSERLEIYIVTESVFSMDGDAPSLKALAEFCKINRYNLIVDEAHAVGVFGKKGNGFIQEHGLQDTVLARIVTFGKAMGAHGAAILGNKKLKEYLINFARSFVYTTGLPPHSIATILASYRYMSGSAGSNHNRLLRENIAYFNLTLKETRMQGHFIPSDSAIHCCIVEGNKKTKSISQKLRDQGFDVKPILSPTVPEGFERLRFCLHSYNTRQQITEVLRQLKTYLC